MDIVDITDVTDIMDIRDIKVMKIIKNMLQTSQSSMTPQTVPDKGFGPSRPLQLAGVKYRENENMYRYMYKSLYCALCYFNYMCCLTAMFICVILSV
jgi:hypothetical protein